MFYELPELDPQDVASGRATPEQVETAILVAFSWFNPDRSCVSKIYVAMQFEYLLEDRSYISIAHAIDGQRRVSLAPARIWIPVAAEPLALGLAHRLHTDR